MAPTHPGEQPVAPGLRLVEPAGSGAPQAEAAKPKRAAPRGRTLLRARIVFNGGLSSLDCTVRDLSDTGAKLEFADPVAIPVSFRLIIPKLDQSHQVQKRWQREGNVGVSFDRRPTASTSGFGEDAPTIARLEAENARLRAQLEAIRADPSQARLLLERFV